MADDRKHKTERLQWRADALANYRMLPDNCPFVRSQTSGLQQNRIRYSNLSYIVHDSGTTQGCTLIFRKFQLFT